MHCVQHVMLSESTPILCGAIPAFEKFMSKWEGMMEHFPNSKLYIKEGLNCVFKYYAQLDHTNAYIITMCKPLHLSVPNN